MSLKLYMDVQVHRAITIGLRLRGVDVLTAQEDERSQTPDDELLDRATSLGRVLFSNDHDFLREATSRQQRGESFTGVIYVHQIALSVGRCISDLELIAKVCSLEDLADHVEYLPLSRL